jgi:hypothetical protein
MVKSWRSRIGNGLMKEPPCLPTKLPSPKEPHAPRVEGMLVLIIGKPSSLRVEEITDVLAPRNRRPPRSASTA